MSKVDDWIACDLRYVGETKLNRLTDDELAKLYFGLGKKHSLSITTVSAAREVMIQKLMTMKKEIQVAYGTPAPAPAIATKDPQAEAAKAVEEIFAAEAPKPEVGATPEDVLTEEEKAAKRDREERAAAFVQLAAAASLPPSVPTGDAPEKAEATPDVSPVTVDTHRIRVCSFNACKMRLGNANKAYTETTNGGGAKEEEEYEGTQKGAELAQKWITLAAIMADFDVIMLQEVPGTEKVMNDKVETFAAMLDIATEDGRYWTAVSSQKSGKGGKTVGPGAEVHVCFVKSPVQLKSWNTLRKVGATELDYAPLQVVVHDERFEAKADRDFVITSVHLPPSKRQDARDTQIDALLRNYSASDTSEYRMQLPFGPSKEAGIAPVHVVCGDFNAYPGEAKYHMESYGFVNKIPKNAATTSGKENFDNVLVNTHANENFLVGGGIMQLKDPHNAAMSQVGISDHFPIFVEVQEVQKTRKALARVKDTEPEPEVHRKAYEEEPSVEEREALVVIEAVGVAEAAALESVREEEEEDEEEEQEEEAEDEAEVEEAAKAVVREAMNRVTQSVVEAAAKEEAPPTPEAPPEAAPSTEEPPPEPPHAPEPPPDSETPPAEATNSAAEELTLDQELAEVLGEDLEEAQAQAEAELPMPPMPSEPELDDWQELAHAE